MKIDYKSSKIYIKLPTMKKISLTLTLLILSFSFFSTTYADNPKKATTNNKPVIATVEIPESLTSNHKLVALIKETNQYTFDYDTKFD